MKITTKTSKVKERKNSVVGFATVYFTDEENNFNFAVKNIQIMESGKTKELFLGFPTRKDPSAQDGYSDIAFPCNKETRNAISKVVIEDFLKS